jgi:hypothetical protein
MEGNRADKLLLIEQGALCSRLNREFHTNPRQMSQLHVLALND